MQPANGFGARLGFALLLLAFLVEGQDEQRGYKIVLVRADNATKIGAAVSVAAVAAPASRTPARRVVDVLPTGSRLDLPPGVWRVRVASDGLWSPALQIDTTRAGSHTEELRLSTWSTGRVILPFESAEAIEPGKATALLRIAERDDATVIESAVTCHSQPKALLCELPAAQLDLVARVEAMVPEYYFDILPQAGAEQTLGRRPLRSGASVAGWISPAPTGPACETTVALSPSDGIPLCDPPGRERRVQANAPAQFVSACANSRGFFQVAPLSPGNYVVHAHSGARTSEPLRIDVLPSVETKLTRPMMLQPAVDLSLRLTPPVDPNGNPWSLHLLAGAGRHPTVLVANEAVPDDGEWSKPGLAAGKYRVSVRSGTGAIWLEREIELTPGVGAFSLDLTPVSVSGSVRLGGKALGRGRIVLATKATRIPLGLDEDGRFSGQIPRLEEGEEANPSWGALVESEDPKLRRMVEELPVNWVSPREALVEVEFPDLGVRGRIQRADGLELPPAVIVTALGDGQDTSSLAQAMVLPEDKGRFRIDGIAAGTYRVHAEADGLESDVITAVSSDQGTELSLTLRERRRLEGVVLSPEGLGIPGAEVFLFAPGSSFAAPLRTDQSGRFTAQLSPGTKQTVALVAAVGWAYKAARVPVDQERLVLPLEREGGTILLDGVGGTDTGLFVLRQGAFVPLPVLRRWASLNGGSVGEGRLTVPQMEHGVYSVCRLEGEQSGAIESGQPPPESCTSGTVHRGSELRLAIPPERSAN